MYHASPRPGVVRTTQLPQHPSTRTCLASQGPGRLWNSMQMNRCCGYLKGLSSHPFLRAQPPSSPGEVDQSPGVKVLWRTHRSLRSPGSVAAEEGIEHGLLHALLVLPTPGDHRPVTVCCVQVVAITGKCKAHNRLI